MNRQIIQSCGIKAFWLMAVVLAVPAATAAESVKTPDPETWLPAVMAEDWDTVAARLGPVTVRTPDPVLRCIKAHARLAVNRNNESVELLAGLTFEDLEQWARWCDEQEPHYPDRAVLHYFRGDIRARIGDYPGAIACFTKAVERCDSLLARNARGTVYMVLGEYDRALADLRQVRTRAPAFSDASNTLAMMNIRLKAGLLENSKKSFQAVLDMHPDFALALHGLGCLELLESKTAASPEANKHLQQALEQLPTASDILIANETDYLSAVYDKQAAALFAEAGDEGTYFQRSYQLNRLVDTLDKLETIQNQMPPETSDFQKNQVQSRIYDTQEKIARTLYDMPSGIRQQHTIEHPEVSGKALEAVSQIENRYTAGYKELQTAANLTRGVLTVTTRGPLNWGLSGLTRAAEEHVRNISSEITTLKKDVIQDRQNAIPYTPPSIPDQTQNGHVQRAIAQGTYQPAASTAGYAESLGVQKVYPGQHPGTGTGPVDGATVHTSSTPVGGASMDKLQIIWNDGEWPFRPVFGLLYQAPPTAVESIEPDGKGDEQ